MSAFGRLVPDVGSSKRPYTAAKHKKWGRSFDPKLAPFPGDMAVTVSTSISWRICKLSEEKLEACLGCLRFTLTGMCGEEFY